MAIGLVWKGFKLYLNMGLKRCNNLKRRAWQWSDDWIWSYWSTTCYLWTRQKIYSEATTRSRWLMPHVFYFSAQIFTSKLPSSSEKDILIRRLIKNVNIPLFLWKNYWCVIFSFFFLDFFFFFFFFFCTIAFKVVFERNWWQNCSYYCFLWFNLVCNSLSWSF